MQATNKLAFFRLQQIISPSLPVGAFTYSQGMEWAVESGWIKDSETLRSWLEACLSDSLAYLELPILIRLFQSCVEDTQVFHKWSEYLLACRETKELRMEERQRAYALVSVLNKLPDADVWFLARQKEAALLNTALAGMALAAKHWHLSLDDLIQGYAWSWLDNMVNVGIKLVPLGQSDGQRVLYHLSENLIEVCEQAKHVADEDIGASTMALAIASSLHETQYCRLFRS